MVASRRFRARGAPVDSHPPWTRLRANSTYLYFEETGLEQDGENRPHELETCVSVALSSEAALRRAIGRESGRVKIK